jgi:hypothetical protein
MVIQDTTYPDPPTIDFAGLRYGGVMKDAFLSRGVMITALIT